MNSLDRINDALDKGLAKEVFDQVRNYLICAFLLTIGLFAFEHKKGAFFSQIPIDAFNYAGLGIIGLSFLLFCLNLLDGVRKISRYKHSSLLSAILIIVYAIMSIRVIELALYFRTI